MKIIRVIPYLDFGGVEKRIELTAKGFMSKPEHELLIVVLSKLGKTGVLIEQLGFEVFYLNEDPKIPNIRLFKKLYELLKVKRPDVVHCSGSEANFHGLIAGYLAGVPVRIGEEIGFPNHGPKWKLIFKLVYKLASKVIAISESVKCRIVELGEVEIKKVVVVYNPVGVGSWSKDCSPLSIPPKVGGDVLYGVEELGGRIKNENTFIFVATCRLVPVKNLDTLIKVFSKIVTGSKPIDLKLWLVGDGLELGKLKDLALELGVMDKVIFWGFQKDVFPFLENSDAFVLPSLSEGFSISLVEAMSCGLPCIATREGGPSEIINADTGFLVNPFDSEDLESKMQFVLDMVEDERILLGRKAKKDIEKRFSLDKYMADLLGLYDSLSK